MRMRMVCAVVQSRRRSEVRPPTRSPHPPLHCVGGRSRPPPVLRSRPCPRPLFPMRLPRLRISLAAQYHSVTPARYLLLFHAAQRTEGTNNEGGRRRPPPSPSPRIGRKGIRLLVPPFAPSPSRASIRRRSHRIASRKGGAVNCLAFSSFSSISPPRLFPRRFILVPRFIAIRRRAGRKRRRGGGEAGTSVGARSPRVR